MSSVRMILTPTHLKRHFETFDQNSLYALCPEHCTQTIDDDLPFCEPEDMPLHIVEIVESESLTYEKSDRA